MERRNFIKNLAALAVISQIDIAEAKESKQVTYDLMLKSDKCEIKMNLLEISTTEKSDKIYCEAVINQINGNPFGKVQIIYKPGTHTTLAGEGYVTDWKLNYNEVKFKFRVTRGMIIN